MSEHASPLRFLQDRPLVRLIGAHVAGVVITLLVVSFLIFSMLYLAPGDTASFLVGDQTVSPEYLEIVRAQYGLDKPFWWDRLAHRRAASRFQAVDPVPRGCNHLSPRIGNSLFLVLWLADRA